jgi:hypothetical protein
MNKADAMASVVQMTKLAASTDSDGERQNAEAQTVRLRLQHGISDDDLRRAMSIEDGKTSNGQIGGLLWGFSFYRDKILPYVKAIEDEIQHVLDIIEQQTDANQAKYLMELSTTMKSFLDDKSHWQTIQSRRNAIITKIYNDAKERILTANPTYADSPEALHEGALNSPQMPYGLTRAQAESIVGVHRDDLRYEGKEAAIVKEALEQGCDCQHYWTGQRSKKRNVLIDHDVTTQYIPRTLQHRKDCAITPQEHS